MRQHQYFDVSDLNAEFDQIPLQGVGGGILSTGPMGSLGVSASNYPWKEYSADTAALQKLANDALKAHGYCAIPTDGKMDAATCGAIKRMLEVSGQTDQSPPATCQSFTTPAKCAGGSLTKGSAGSSGGTAWVVGGLVVAAGAIGAALYFTKKGR